ncbi:uncharacterized protein LOC103908645 isoform X1 [Tachysurus ichikawai]
MHENDVSVPDLRCEANCSPPLGSDDLVLTDHVDDVDRLPSRQLDDFKERWLALFCESEIKNEFRRITTVPLEPTFLQKLDLYTPKLLDLFKTKGGDAGIKIRSMLDSLCQQVEDKRDAVIQCLLSYLGEYSEELNEAYQDVRRDMIEDSFTNHVMKIIVLGSTTGEEDANIADVIIVIEGTEVLSGCKDLTNACLLLMGFIYSLNLSYPSKLRNTFEVFQKIFLGLDALKFSPMLALCRESY